MNLTYQRKHRLGKIHDELLAAIPALRPAGGQDALLLVSGDGETLKLVVPDSADRAAIDAVVAAHDPTTPSAWEQAVATADANDATLRDRLGTALANLETANTNWATLTAAQKDAALRLGIRVDAALIRLALRRLEAN